MIGNFLACAALGAPMFKMDGFMTPAECRKKAQACRMHAAGQRDGHRADLLAIAAQWEKLARQYEYLAKLQAWISTGKLVQPPAGS